METPYTLTMTTYEFNIFTGKHSINKMYVKDCYLYKDSDAESEILFASMEENSEIYPGMITDDGDKVYFFKNWSFYHDGFQKSLNFSGDLKITIFDNSYKPNNEEDVKNYLNEVVDNAINNFENLKKLINE